MLSLALESVVAEYLGFGLGAIVTGITPRPGVGLVANAHLQERAALRLRSDDRLDSPADAGARDESQLRPRRTGARVDQRGTADVGHFARR
jgi:hypothetical protein